MLGRSRERYGLSPLRPSRQNNSVMTNNDLQSDGVRWVQRMVSGQGITVSDREAHWWAVYLRQFFRYARERGDKLEAGPLVRAYLESLELRLPKEQRWQAEKAGR